MERNGKNLYNNAHQQSQDLVKNGKNEGSIKKDACSSFPVNLAEKAWLEIRKQWVGDKPQESAPMLKDPILSWNTSYEDLLSSYEPFEKRIPLAEMVDFLADVWHAEDLCD